MTFCNYRRLNLIEVGKGLIYFFLFACLLTGIVSLLPNFDVSMRFERLPNLPFTLFYLVIVSIVTPILMSIENEKAISLLPFLINVLVTIGVTVAISRANFPLALKIFGILLALSFSGLACVLLMVSF